MFILFILFTLQLINSIYFIKVDQKLVLDLATRFTLSIINNVD